VQRILFMSKDRHSQGPPRSLVIVVTGHWSLVTGHWSLVIGHWSLVIGHWSLVTGHWSLVTGHWSLVTGHWSVVIGHIVFDLACLPCAIFHTTYARLIDVGQLTNDK